MAQWFYILIIGHCVLISWNKYVRKLYIYILIWYKNRNLIIWVRYLCTRFKFNQYRWSHFSETLTYPIWGPSVRTFTFLGVSPTQFYLGRWSSQITENQLKSSIFEKITIFFLGLIRKAHIFGAWIFIFTDYRFKMEKFLNIEYKKYSSRYSGYREGHAETYIHPSIHTSTTKYLLK